MKFLQALIVASLIPVSAFAQDATKPAPPTASAPSHGCLAVSDIGSHGFRNFMLAGVAGALLSKQQYKVVDAVDYPAKIGQKFHGNDLQTLQTGGTRVAILDKNYTPDELHKACH